MYALVVVKAMEKDKTEKRIEERRFVIESFQGRCPREYTI